MGEVKVGEISLSYWRDGYPYWFHIRQHNKEISFTHNDAYQIGQALVSMAIQCRANAHEKEKDEFGIPGA